MKEYRCHKCNAILYKASGNIDVELICKKCRTINYPYVPLKGEKLLRGAAFQNKCITHRCDNCYRVLLKSNGDGIIEIMCAYKNCKHLSIHDTIAIRGKTFKFKRTELFRKIEKSVAK